MVQVFPSKCFRHALDMDVTLKGPELRRTGLAHWLEAKEFDFLTQLGDSEKHIAPTVCVPSSVWQYS